MDSRFAAARQACFVCAVRHIRVRSRHKKIADVRCAGACAANDVPAIACKLPAKRPPEMAPAAMAKPEVAADVATTESSVGVVVVVVVVPLASRGPACCVARGSRSGGGVRVVVLDGDNGGTANATTPFRPPEKCKAKTSSSNVAGGCLMVSVGEPMKNEQGRRAGLNVVPRRTCHMHHETKLCRGICDVVRWWRKLR